jgi:alkaline phosphatase D
LRLAANVRLLALLLLVATSSFAEEVPAPLPSRIAFGSCSHQDRPQPIWDSIVAQEPQLFLFIGDNIYGDTADMTMLREKYQRLGAQPGFQKLLATCPVVATWDDHDYGRNDAGSEFPAKAESQQAFLDFFRVPQDSPRRKQEGVYHSAIFEQAGRRLQVIMLDTRYHRSRLLRTKGTATTKSTAVPNEEPGATILGEVQWQWLEGELRRPADLRIIASSIQVIPEEHRFEKWANFPRERNRLFQLIGETRASGVIFISGDRHMAEISRLASGASPAGYPIYDVTSSGLSHARSSEAREVNRHRTTPENFEKLNFGMIEIDWEEADPVIQLRIHDLEGERVLEQKILLSELRPR